MDLDTTDIQESLAAGMFWHPAARSWLTCKSLQQTWQKAAARYLRCGPAPFPKFRSDDSWEYHLSFWCHADCPGKCHWTRDRILSERMPGKKMACQKLCEKMSGRMSDWMSVRSGDRQATNCRIVHQKTCHRKWQIECFKATTIECQRAGQNTFWIESWLQCQVHCQKQSLSESMPHKRSDKMLHSWEHFQFWPHIDCQEKWQIASK